MYTPSSPQSLPEVARGGLAHNYVTRLPQAGRSELWSPSGWSPRLPARKAHLHGPSGMAGPRRWAFPNGRRRL